MAKVCLDSAAKYTKAPSVRTIWSPRMMRRYISCWQKQILYSEMIEQECDTIRRERERAEETFAHEAFNDTKTQAISSICESKYFRSFFALSSSRSFGCWWVHVRAEGVEWLRKHRQRLTNISSMRACDTRTPEPEAETFTKLNEYLNRQWKVNPRTKKRNPFLPCRRKRQRKIMRKYYFVKGYRPIKWSPMEWHAFL